MNPIRLLVVDDHSLFRRGLVSLLMQDERFATPDQAADVGEALRCLSHAVPDLILLDNRLPGVRGVDAIGGLREAAPGVKILMLTVSENEDDLAAALQAGADGYLLKTVESDDLCNAILKVLSGESVISADMMTKLVCVFRQSRSDAQTPPSLPLTESQEADLINTLSAREKGVLKLIVHGASNKSIARQLDIAEATVKIHVQHILRKLQLSSRVQAAVYAANQRL
jgi:two-component system nitrate/nitrite response regulator NarL